MVSMPASGSPARYLRQVAKNISRTSSRLGLNTGFRPELAQVADQALRAAGLAREADVAPVQDQPVMRILQVLRRGELEQLELHFERVLARRNSRAIRNAENMRIDRHRRLAEGGVQHYVGGLAAHARQGFERLAVLRHGAAMLLQKHLRKRYHVLGLGSVKADALDVG